MSREQLGESKTSTKPGSLGREGSHSLACTRQSARKKKHQYPEALWFLYKANRLGKTEEHGIFKTEADFSSRTFPVTCVCQAEVGWQEQSVVLGHLGVHDVASDTSIRFQGCLPTLRRCTRRHEERCLHSPMPTVSMFRPSNLVNLNAIKSIIADFIFAFVVISTPCCPTTEVSRCGLTFSTAKPRLKPSELQKPQPLTSFPEAPNRIRMHLEVSGVHESEGVYESLCGVMRRCARLYHMNPMRLQNSAMLCLSSG